MALVVLCAIDQMNDIVHLAVDSGAKQLRLWTVLQVVGQLIVQAGSSAPQALNVFELIGSRTGAAGVTDLLFAASSLRACCAETRRARSTGRSGRRVYRDEAHCLRPTEEAYSKRARRPNNAHPRSRWLGSRAVRRMRQHMELIGV